MTYQLSEIAKTITTGQIMNRVTVGKDEEDNSSYFNMQELVPGAISGGVVHMDNTLQVRLKKRPLDNKMTKQNDIVIKLSSPYDCALVTEAEEGLLVPSYCAIISGIDEKHINIKYLVGYLNSEFAREKMLIGVSTSAGAMVKQRSLSDLEIVVPDLKKQAVIGEAYWQSCQKKYVLEKMVLNQQGISDSIIDEVLRQETSDGNQ